ncbi:MULTISPECIES: type II toxin-antitoxin system HicA family toxin [unclassified Cedecea]|uniref:type II toxin-antitoxin system HicA family toxin n=2 Tax=unclassified Cedecea TaxID=2649846 RepID=UPI003018AE52
MDEGMTSAELIRMLKKLGWLHVRTRGSHHIFEKEGEANPVVVPHPTKDLAPERCIKFLSNWVRNE